MRSTRERSWSPTSTASDSANSAIGSTLQCRCASVHMITSILPNPRHSQQSVRSLGSDSGSSPELAQSRTRFGPSSLHLRQKRTAPASALARSSLPLRISASRMAIRSESLLSWAMVPISPRSIRNAVRSVSTKGALPTTLQRGLQPAPKLSSKSTSACASPGKAEAAPVTRPPPSPMVRAISSRNARGPGRFHISSPAMSNESQAPAETVQIR